MKQSWETNNGAKFGSEAWPINAKEVTLTGATFTFTLAELNSLAIVLAEADPNKLNDNEKFLVESIREINTISKMNIFPWIKR